MSGMLLELHQRVCGLRLPHMLSHLLCDTLQIHGSVSSMHQMSVPGAPEAHLVACI